MVVLSAQSVNNVKSHLLMDIDSSPCVTNSALGLPEAATTTSHTRSQGHSHGMATSHNHRINGGLFLLCGLLVLAGTVPVTSARTCKEASLCCSGRDSACVVQKAPINSIIEDPINDKPCYCDHACLKLGDCCDDFKQFCGGMYLMTAWDLMSL